MHFPATFLSTPTVMGPAGDCISSSDFLNLHQSHACYTCLYKPAFFIYIFLSVLCVIFIGFVTFLLSLFMPHALRFYSHFTKTHLVKIICENIKIVCYKNSIITTYCKKHASREVLTFYVNYHKMKECMKCI